MRNTSKMAKTIGVFTHCTSLFVKSIHQHIVGLVLNSSLRDSFFYLRIPYENKAIKTQSENKIPQNIGKTVPFEGLISENKSIFFMSKYV